MHTITDQDPLRVVADRSVAQVLDRITTVFDRRGWGQGTLEESPTGPVCLVGAVVVAVAGDSAIGTWESGLLCDDDDDLVDETARVLSEAVGFTPSPFTGMFDIEAWNDADGRTFDEVLAAVRKAQILAGGEPADLHDLHPQPGEPASAPLPPGVEGFPLGGAS